MQLANQFIHSDEGRKGLQDVGAEVFFRPGCILYVIAGRIEHLSLILFPGRPREEVRTVRLILGDGDVLGFVLQNLVLRYDPDVSRESYAMVQLDKVLVC